VHTAANPGGEVRGQILAANELFTTFCNGAQETPPNASTHTACGTFVLNAAAGTLSYSITTSLPAITAMHLHTGAPGTSGGVAIGLTGTPPVMTGTTPALTAAQLLNLRRGNLYLNLHTTAFPGGEIRGNLRHGGEPYGFGSPDGAGAAPRVEVFGYAGVGSTFDVVLLDAAPSSATFAFVGTQGAFWPAAASVLPFDGSGFGATSAFIWTDWDPTFFFPLATDAEGCAKLNISLPALPLFDCFRVAVQFFTVDVAANPFGASVSDAINFRFAPATFPY